MSGNTYDLSGYKGGIITTGSVSWDNLASQTFTGKIQVGQLKDTLDLVYGNKMDYPTMNNISIGDYYDPLVAGSDGYVNLYGQNLDTIIKKYYDGNNNTKFSFADSREFDRVGSYKFDAKSALNGESMYNNGSVNSSLYELDLNAALLMNTFVDGVKNVKITGINKTGLSNTSMQMSNVVFQSDVSDISFTGNAYGLIDFAVAPAQLPIAPSANPAAKIILRKILSSTDVSGLSLLDLSNVDNISEMGYIKSSLGGYIHEVRYKNSQFEAYGLPSNLDVGVEYVEDTQSVIQKNGNLKVPVWTNNRWEKYGNEETYDESELIQVHDITTYYTSFLSRPINQTLMQRLLGSNQPYYS